MSQAKAEKAKNYTDELQQIMKAASIPSYRALATQAEVSRWQIQQLRAGAIANMKVAVVLNLADALNISINELMHRFGLEHEALAADSALRQEYERLQGQMIAQMDGARSQFQSESLQTLETWLTQWPTIAKRAKDRGKDVPAANILSFVKPVEKLMAEWEVAAIASVDDHIPYDPNLHQLKGDTADPGELVHVTHTGSLHKGNLLHRAEVKKIVKKITP